MSLQVIDFHNHHIPEQFKITAGLTQPASQRARWEKLAVVLADENALLQDIREGHLEARVVNIPGNLIADIEGHVPHETILAANDHLSEMTARHSGKLHGLATVDGYDGERSAREAERAVQQLGMRGLFMDCARGDLLIDTPKARPTLEVAASLGVPIFAHPVAPQPLTRQMEPYGLIGTLFARGAVNSAALIALVEGGVFSELPGLRIVVTAHAIGGLAMVAGLSGQSRLSVDAVEVMRRHVSIDTTLANPALLRLCVDLLGSANVLAGSDWPIAGQTPVTNQLQSAMDAARFSQTERHGIAADNARRLLGL